MACEIFWEYSVVAFYSYEKSRQSYELMVKHLRVIAEGTGLADCL